MAREVAPTLESYKLFTKITRKRDPLMNLNLVPVVGAVQR